MVTKFILHYQDHLTKFALLRPITSKLAAEVGFQLLDIFLLFGVIVIFTHPDYKHIFYISVTPFNTSL
jgi:hypothetical protein